MQQATFAQVDECCLHAIRRVFCIYKDHIHTRKMTYTFKRILKCLLIRTSKTYEIILHITY